MRGSTEDTEMFTVRLHGILWRSNLASKYSTRLPSKAHHPRVRAFTYAWSLSVM